MRRSLQNSSQYVLVHISYSLQYLIEVLLFYLNFFKVFFFLSTENVIKEKNILHKCESTRLMVDSSQYQIYVSQVKNKRTKEKKGICSSYISARQILILPKIVHWLYLELCQPFTCHSSIYLQHIHAHVEKFKIILQICISHSILP